MARLWYNMLRAGMQFNKHVLRMFQKGDPMLDRILNLVPDKAKSYAKNVYGRILNSCASILLSIQKIVVSKKTEYRRVKRTCVFFAAFAFTMVVMGGMSFETNSPDRVVEASAAVQSVTSYQSSQMMLAKNSREIVTREQGIIFTIPKAGSEASAVDGKSGNGESPEPPGASQTYPAQAMDYSHSAAAKSALHEQELIAKKAATNYYNGVTSMDTVAAQPVHAEEPKPEGTEKSTAEESKPKPDTTLQQPANASVASQQGGFIYSEKIPMSRELQAYTYDKCVERGLEYELILAIIWRESRFTPGAVNYNAIGTRYSGIMQINDCNRQWQRDQYGVDNLMDPYQNINAGTAMLGGFTDKYGSHYALMAYQYGEAGMRRQIANGVTTNKLIEIVYHQRDYYRQFV